MLAILAVSKVSGFPVERPTQSIPLDPLPHFAAGYFPQQGVKGELPTLCTITGYFLALNGFFLWRFALKRTFLSSRKLSWWSTIFTIKCSFSRVSEWSQRAVRSWGARGCQSYHGWCAAFNRPQRVGAAQRFSSPSAVEQRQSLVAFHQNLRTSVASENDYIFF